MIIINNANTDILINSENLVSTKVLKHEGVLRYSNRNFRLINVHSDVGSCEIRFRNGLVEPKCFGRIRVECLKTDVEKTIVITAV